MNFINVLDHGYVRLVDHMGNDLSIINAARVSYNKESTQYNERDDNLLSFLLEENHTSPLRHATLTYEIYSPLFVARQWWKYAVASTHIDDTLAWNESSRRYITEEPVFYNPTNWRNKPENSKQGSGPTLPPNISKALTTRLDDIIDYGIRMYNKALEEGVAPEQARLYLPAYAMYVRWRWTTSLAAVLHFLQQRLSHDAQQEIQQYAQAIHTLTQPHYPNTFSKIQVTGQ